MTNPLDHPLAYEVLLALDGKVSGNRTKYILDHLAICESCRDSVHDVESVISMLATTHSTHTVPLEYLGLRYLRELGAVRW
jgi:predicted anti-sigma-YlaC factor YlaD